MQKSLSIIMTVMFAVTMQAQRNTPVKTQESFPVYNRI